MAANKVIHFDDDASDAGCKQEKLGGEACTLPLTPDDRRLIEDIHHKIDEIAKTVDRDERVIRGLSSTLIGKINGETIDDKGGRIGRLESMVTWSICGVTGILVWLLAQFITKLVK